MSNDVRADLLSSFRDAGIQDAFAPGDPRYGAALEGFNRAVTRAPLAVVAARSVADVAGAVDVANRLDLPVGVLGTGHAAHAPTVDGIVIATRGLASVSVSDDGATARVGAGATWTDVLAAVAPLGRAALCGSAPHVGVIGYLLGGGMGPVARTFGFAADHVRSLAVVTADAETVRADAHAHPDLFWALRGGKDGIGVVVEAEIDLFPLATVYGGALFFSAEDTPGVVRAFAEWARDLPEQMTTSVALLRLPPLPQLPEPIRGKFVCAVRIGYVGTAADAEALMAPMRAVAHPVMDAVGELPYAEIGRIHADPVDPLAVAEGGILLGALDDAAVDAFLGACGPQVDVPLIAAELRRMGGALARTPDPANAVGGREADWSLHIVGAPVPELLDTVIPGIIRGVFAALHPWATGTTQANFVGASNPPADDLASWSPDVLARLRDVHRTYDPRGRFPSSLSA